MTRAMELFVSGASSVSSISGVKRAAARVVLAVLCGAAGCGGTEAIGTGGADVPPAQSGDPGPGTTDPDVMPPPRIEHLTGLPPVQLVYASAYTDSRNCLGCEVWGGVVEVEDLHPDKEVTLVYTLEGVGTVGEIKAAYLRKLPSGRELWRFGNLARNARFSIRYRAGTEVHWDRGDGSGYLGRISGGRLVSSPLGPGRDVVVTAVSSTPYLFDWWGRKLNVTLLVRNIHPTKEVKIRYTTDSWATVKEASAEYFVGEGPGGEIWNLHQNISANAREVSFAAMARQNGAEAWDNNYNQNFTCRIDTAPGSRWTCYGAALLRCPTADDGCEGVN